MNCTINLTLSFKLKNPQKKKKQKTVRAAFSTGESCLAWSLVGIIYSLYLFVLYIYICKKLTIIHS